MSEIPPPSPRHANTVRGADLRQCTLRECDIGGGSGSPTFTTLTVTEGITAASLDSPIVRANIINEYDIGAGTIIEGVLVSDNSITADSITVVAATATTATVGSVQASTVTADAVTADAVTADTVTSSTVVTATISEAVDEDGVMVDGVRLQDGGVWTDVISEGSAGSGVTVDGVLLRDSTVDATDVTADNVHVDVVNEKTGGNGLLVETVFFRDGLVAPTSLSFDNGVNNMTAYVSPVVVPVEIEGTAVSGGSATINAILCRIGNVVTIMFASGEFIEGTGGAGSAFITVANLPSFATPSTFALGVAPGSILGTSDSVAGSRTFTVEPLPFAIHIWASGGPGVNPSFNILRIFGTITYFAD